MTIDESLELIKKYNDCNNAIPMECCDKECEECEHKYDEQEWYQMFNQIEDWLEELKKYRELADKFKKLVDNSPILKAFIDTAKQKLKEQDNDN